MRNSITIAALIVLSLGAARAGEVRFGDLDLASPGDSEILKSRIAVAATLVCGPIQVDFGVSAATLYEAGREQKACIARVSARAQAKVRALTTPASTTRLIRS